ncbi:MAG: TM2 domain-containing protein [Bacteroidales bacterium]|nr:TM2 domain-containing protein [Bacteroidales bacterium]
MKKFFFCVLALFGLVSLTYADKYELDNNAIDNAFSKATELSFNNMDLSSANLLDLNIGTNSDAMAMMSRGAGKSWVAAAAICFFLGEIGIHRMYLGSSPLMWLYYGVTCCGIFGIVPLIDFIVLIVDGVQNNIGKYCGNSSYFMWM